MNEMDPNPYRSPADPKNAAQDPSSVRVRMRWVTRLSAIAILVGVVLAPLSFMTAFSYIAKADAPKPGVLANYIAMASLTIPVSVCLIVSGVIGILLVFVLGRSDKKRKDYGQGKEF